MFGRFRTQQLRGIVWSGRASLKRHWLVDARIWRIYECQCPLNKPKSPYKPYCNFKKRPFFSFPDIWAIRLLSDRIFLCFVSLRWQYFELGPEPKGVLWLNIFYDDQDSSYWRPRFHFIRKCRKREKVRRKLVEFYRKSFQSLILGPENPAFWRTLRLSNYVIWYTIT